jgi:hypothetical protein
MVEANHILQQAQLRARLAQATIRWHAVKQRRPSSWHSSAVQRGRCSRKACHSSMERTPPNRVDSAEGAYTELSPQRNEPWRGAFAYKAIAQNRRRTCRRTSQPASHL